METLDVRQLEALRAVVELRSVTRAAAALGVSQPAVSSLLSRLERRVGFQLFARVGRTLHPTAEATILCREAGRALAAHEQLGRVAAGIREDRFGSLAIAAHPGPSIAWLPPVAARFIKERPGVTISFISRRSQSIREMIPTRAFDLAFAEPPIEHPMAMVRRFRLGIVAVMAPDSRLAARKVITPRLLDGQPIIAMYPGHAAQVAATRAFEAAGIRWAPVASCDYYATAIGLAAEGAGIAFVDRISAEAAAASGRVAARPVSPDLAYEFAVFHPVGQPLPRLAAAFLALFEATYARHLEPLR
jgi:DNA-binding transcriptional LysR family regulator